MRSDDLCWLSATELAALVRTKKVSPVEILSAVLDRIDTVNPRLNAYVLVVADQARKAARAAERAVARRARASARCTACPSP